MQPARCACTGGSVWEGRGGEGRGCGAGKCKRQLHKQQLTLLLWVSAATCLSRSSKRSSSCTICSALSASCSRRSLRAAELSFAAALREVLSCCTAERECCSLSTSPTATDGQTHIHSISLSLALSNTTCSQEVSLSFTSHRECAVHTRGHLHHCHLHVVG